MLEPSIEHLKSSREEIDEVSSHLSKATFDRKEIEPASVLEPYRSYIQTLVAGLYINFVMYIPFYFWILIAFIVIFSGFFGRALLLLYCAYIYLDHKQRFSTINGIGLGQLYGSAFPLFGSAAGCFFAVGSASSFNICCFTSVCMPLRNSRMSDYLREYFPVDLVKTVELPPNRNYLMVSVPHGVIGTGVSVNMGLNIGKWLQLFPGIRPKSATLDVYLRTPFLRELLRSWGLVSCSKEALLLQLAKSNDPNHPHNLDGYTSNAVALLVGGAHEALDCRPGCYTLTLRKRKGFVKLAITAGSPIVPSFSFGEVDVLHQMDNPPGSMLRKMQIFVKDLCGFSPLVVIGRGPLSHVFGLAPFRKPIVQVIGAPIEVKQMDEPDPKYVEEIHQQVIDSIRDLFEKYKHKYLEDPAAAKLVIN